MNVINKRFSTNKVEKQWVRFVWIDIDNLPTLDIVVHSGHHGLQDPEGFWVICQGVWVSTEKQTTSPWSLYIKH